MYVLSAYKSLVCFINPPVAYPMAYPVSCMRHEYPEVLTDLAAI